jgi:hypothetical protein
MLYTGDKKYVSVKKILINPATIPTFIGLIFFLLPFSKGSSVILAVTEFSAVKKIVFAIKALYFLTFKPFVLGVNL